MIELADQDLLLRLASFEDQFVERKTSSDKKGWLKTAVAFANTTPVGYPAVLFIGVRNDGTIEGVTNLDKLQQTLNDILGEAYPPIPTFPKVLEKDGQQFLAVIIPGSPERPHFAGHSYVRSGSETIKASDKQFLELIAQRNSKAREILRWKDKTITVHYIELHKQKDGNVIDCNQFYVTVRFENVTESFSLTTAEISFDNQKDTLRLEVRSVL